MFARQAKAASSRRHSKTLRDIRQRWGKQTPPGTFDPHDSVLECRWLDTALAPLVMT